MSIFSGIGKIIKKALPVVGSVLGGPLGGLAGGLIGGAISGGGGGGKDYGGGIPNPYVQNLQDRAFYNQQRGQALRSIDAQYAPQRSYALQALEARGLGRSSEVGRTLGSLAGSEGMADQQALSDIGGQEFSGRQQQINAYLNYMYQKNLQKQAKSKSVLDYVEGIGTAIPYLLHPKGDTTTSGSSYDPGYYASTTPGGNTGLPQYPDQYPQARY